MLTVGEFSRATQLTVKTLRHYHEVGLLEPAEVDRATHYRYYAPAQIGQAHVIRRLRDLDMPVAEVKAVLAEPDATARSALIAAHLARLENALARTQTAVASLRAILEQPAYGVSHRSVPLVRAIAIRATVDHEDLGSWWRGGLAELRAAVPAGKLGGMFDGALFADGVGEAIVFTAVEKLPRLTGRLTQFDVPAAELALVTHRGSHANVDVAYGALGAYVATHEIAVDGMVREYYVADPLGDPASWVTEIAWPVFRSR